MKQQRKMLSLVLAIVMAVSVLCVGTFSASADELAPGGYGTLGEYTPQENVKTNHLMFAMPGAWQNDTTKNDKCGGAAGIYWWSGIQTPDDVAGGHGWPGYKTKKVEEEGVENLYAIDVPTYGNGEAGNATQIIWNNYLDGGMERDPAKNPFYDAAAQTRDFPGQYYSRGDLNKTYEPLFRYVYKTQLAKYGVDVAAIDEKSDTFWEDLNKAAAAALGPNHEWNKLDEDEKTYQIDEVLDPKALDFSEFGKYASNFFNEDNVESPEDSQGYGVSFTFDNMVFVVNFDPAKMLPSPQSGKIGFDGEFYFYYGGGEYGSWPTKELNEAKGGVSGNFMSDEYWKSRMEDLSIPTLAPETTTANGTVPAAGTDATSSTSDSAGGNSGNSSNGAVATGQTSLTVIALVILVAGLGVFFFTRKKYQK